MGINIQPRKTTNSKPTHLLLLLLLALRRNSEHAVLEGHIDVVLVEPRRVAADLVPRLSLFCFMDELVGGLVSKYGLGYEHPSLGWMDRYQAARTSLTSMVMCGTTGCAWRCMRAPPPCPPTKGEMDDVTKSSKGSRLCSGLWRGFCGSAVVVWGVDQGWRTWGGDARTEPQSHPPATPARAQQPRRQRSSTQ